MKRSVVTALLKYFIGPHLFLSAGSYANSIPPLFNFSPSLFSPSPFQSPSFLPQGSSILPFCPPQMPPGLCLSLTSFPMTNTTPYGLPSAAMMTPFLAQPKEISKKKSNQLLNQGKWKSYRYSRETHKYQPLSQEERESRDPDDDYIHLREEAPSENSEHPSQTSQQPSQQKPSTQPSPPERTQPSFYENAIIESRDKIYTGRASVIPTTALVVENQQKPDSEKSPQIPETPDSEKSPQHQESPIAEEIRITEPVNPIETVVGKPKTLSCADLNNNTESQVLCIECLSHRSEQKAISKFSKSFEKKFTAKKICVNEGFYIMNQVENNFNNNCRPLRFQEYMKELACQSCQAQIPPAVLLSVMTMESTGYCTITGDDGSSHGLFQINNNSSQFPSCSVEQTTTIQKNSLTQLRREPSCLQNPLINLQESLRILSEKYRLTNNGQSQTFQCHSSDSINTDAWRKAIAGYNGGQRRILNIQEVISKEGKPKALSQTAWDQMSEWEKIRTYYFSCARRDVSHCPSEEFKPSISNLAHTEVLLGSSDKSPSLFKAWSQHTQLNDTSQCH